MIEAHNAGASRNFIEVSQDCCRIWVLGRAASWDVKGSYFFNAIPEWDDSSPLGKINYR